MYRNPAIIDSETILVKLTLYYFKILGLMPLTGTLQRIQQNNIKHWHFSPCRSAGIYNLLLFVVLSGLSYLNMVRLFQVYVPGESPFQQLLYAAYAIVFHLAVLTIIILYLIRCGKVVEILSKINAARKLSDSIDDDYGFYSGLELILKTVAALMTCIAFCLIFSLTFSDNSFMAILARIAGVSCALIANSMVLQYTVFLYFVKLKLKFLNRSLKNVIKESTLANEIQSVQEDCVLKERIDKISCLRKLHFLLIDVSGDMSDFYAMPMLLHVSYTLLIVITFSYLQLKTILKNKLFEAYKYVHYSSFELLFYIMLIVLTRSVSSVENESKKTRIIATEPLYRIQNDKVFEKLKEFSNYLSSGVLEFNVYSYFPLRDSLMITISSTVITHLIISIQYQ